MADATAIGQSITAEVAVVGGGPAGLVCAIALAAAGVDTLVIASPRAADNRTTALHAAPLRKIRLIDDTARLLRAPEVLFDAAEIGLEAFGHNIENRHLLAALEARAAELNLARIAAPALAVESDEHGVTIKHASGTARVLLAIGAAARVSAGSTDAQSGPCAPARRHLDRISH
jgi:2-octaprenyl-6-methoxyphenol hydroxylase